jgi:photosystem II stability/assembly factor-like uncharacterized protein
MKANTAILSVFLMLVLSCEKDRSDNYDWKDISIKGNITLDAISMIDENTGFVGGYSGFDFGSFTVPYYLWGSFGDTLIYAPGNGYFYSTFENQDKPLIDPIIYKTSTGGASWQGILTPFKSRIRDIQFLDENNGYVVTEHEGVFKTTDGCQTWSKIIENSVHYYSGQFYGDPFSSLCFLDKDTGFVYGERDRTEGNLIFLTRDGGLSWKCISISYHPSHPGKHPDIFNDLRKMHFPSKSDTGYVVNRGDLYKTADLGSTWEKIHETNRYNLEVFFVTPQIGYILESQLMTTDGGMTWSKNPDIRIGDIIITVNQKEFYYLSGGSIVKTIAGDRDYYYMTKETDTWIKTLVFPSENVGYALGLGGVILKYVK